MRQFNFTEEEKQVIKKLQNICINEDIEFNITSHKVLISYKIGINTLFHILNDDIDKQVETEENEEYREIEDKAIPKKRKQNYSYPFSKKPKSNKIATVSVNDVNNVEEHSAENDNLNEEVNEHNVGEVLKNVVLESNDKNNGFFVANGENDAENRSGNDAENRSGNDVSYMEELKLDVLSLENLNYKVNVEGLNFKEENGFYNIINNCLTSEVYTEVHNNRLLLDYYKVGAYLNIIWNFVNDTDLRDRPYRSKVTGIIKGSGIAKAHIDKFGNYETKDIKRARDFYKKSTRVYHLYKCFPCVLAQINRSKIITGNRLLEMREEQFRVFAGDIEKVVFENYQLYNSEDSIKFVINHNIITEDIKEVIKNFIKNPKRNVNLKEEEKVEVEGPFYLEIPKYFDNDSIEDVPGDDADDNKNSEYETSSDEMVRALRPKYKQVKKNEIDRTASHTLTHTHMIT